MKGEELYNAKTPYTEKEMENNYLTSDVKRIAKYKHLKTAISRLIALYEPKERAKMEIKENIMENVTYFVKESEWLKKLDHSYRQDFGWGNGYVVIPKGYPGYLMDYDAIHQKWDIDAHGGLTFCSLAKELDWPELDDKYKNGDYWVVGFDTSHHGDSLERWPKKRVEDEAAKLAFRFFELKLLKERKKVTKKQK